MLHSEDTAHLKLQVYTTVIFIIIFNYLLTLGLCLTFWLLCMSWHYQFKYSII